METLRRLIEQLFGPYRITTTYGAPAALTGQPHYGIDIATPWGTAIRSRQGGRVTDVSYDPVGGRQVELEVASGHRVRYAHLSDVLVEEGATVRPSQVVARSGATGRVTGAHTHVEVRQDGKLEDPTEFLATEAGECPPGFAKNILGMCMPESGFLPLPEFPNPFENAPKDYGGGPPTPETPSGAVPKPGEVKPGELVGGAFAGLGEQIGGALAGVAVGAVVILAIVFVAFLGLKNVAEG